jgi:predicted component of type VI protein secretion system
MAKLLLKNGGGQTQELPLNSGLSRIGRNDANDIQIEHASVSSFHCEVSCAGDAVLIKDLGSTNGTFIEGSPVQEAALAHNQRLQLGSVELILDAPSAAASASAPMQAANAPAATAQAPAKPGLSIRLQHATAPESADSQSAAAPSAPSPPAPKNPYQAERPQAELEAKNKIFWGDAPDEVIKYLMRQGINGEESSLLVAGMLQQRAVAIRRAGVRKIILGILLMCVPVASFFIFMAVIGSLPLKLFAVTVAVGLWGAWWFLKGMIMFISPKSEPGNVADK